MDTSEGKLPIIYLRDVTYSELEWLVQFIYSGRCDVPTKHLSSFLTLAKSLRVKGFNDRDEDEEDQEGPGNEAQSATAADTSVVYSVNNPKSPVKRKIRDEVLVRKY